MASWRARSPSSLRTPRRRNPFPVSGDGSTLPPGPKTPIFFRSAENQPEVCGLATFFARNEAAMPVWLEVVLNLAGYAGFLALAARSTSRGGSSNDDHICDDKN